MLAVNYRGSAGRGAKFSRAIFADWGHYEVDDLQAGVDQVVKMGVADPNRLGVGGWSYGGILTDYMIASDTRFKAATSGAGTAFTVAFYGTDQYIIQYDYEIGPPWDPKAWETYQKISYPFLHADRIKTPTLFLGGERDFNVPVQGGQQMYQALRSLGIDTQLVIYPNEFHGISRPSYVSGIATSATWRGTTSTSRRADTRRQRSSVGPSGCGMRIPHRISFHDYDLSHVQSGRSGSDDRGTRRCAARSACRWCGSRRD